MESRALQTQIDRLYQLPLDEFTPARNALAKGAGADTARIRALAKPPVAAWAVNQLRWRDQDVWDELIAAAERARREAEQAVRREECEAARTARDEARAVKTEEQAREALARATSDLQKAEAAVVAARRAREAADTRAREARQAVTAARTRSDSTAADLE